MKNKETKITINLEGQLTISRAEEINKQLQTVLPEINEIHLNIENADLIDVSFLQLVYYADLYFKKNNKKLIINAGNSPVLSETISQAGFENQLESLTKL
ncbi:MAG: hypothetical protein GXX85_12630 [Ignavibacteria bacterium]|nr:hypothetical protein [Ignavibacteria bacterium]